MSTGDRDVERRMEAVAAELRRRVRTVHERVDCPRCGMPRGVRCITMRAGGLTREPAAETKHPHRERLEYDGIYRR